MDFPRYGKDGNEGSENVKKRKYKAGESKGVAFEVIELEKDPKFRKWIVENIGMKWRDYIVSEGDVRDALQKAPATPSSFVFCPQADL